MTSLFSLIHCTDFVGDGASEIIDDGAERDSVER